MQKDQYQPPTRFLSLSVPCPHIHRIRTIYHIYDPVIWRACNPYCYYLCIPAWEHINVYCLWYTCMQLTHQGVITHLRMEWSWTENQLPPAGIIHMKGLWTGSGWAILPIIFHQQYNRDGALSIGNNSNGMVVTKVYNGQWYPVLRPGESLISYQPNWQRITIKCKWKFCNSTVVKMSMISHIICSGIINNGIQWMKTYYKLSLVNKIYV